jgi:hypothetical protein
MQRKLLVLALSVAIGLVLTGCWVFDEIDSGMEQIDKYAASNSSKGKSKEKAETAAAPAPREDAVAEYFRKEDEAGTTRTISPGQVSEGIVKCRIGGSTQFMTKDACAARGGLEGA